MEARGKAAPSLSKFLGEIYLADNQLAEAAKFLAEVDSWCLAKRFQCIT